VKIKSQKDFWSGLMFVATGLGFAAGATNYSFGTSAMLGALVLFKSLTIESEGGDPVGAIPWRPLGLITLAVVVFGLALPKLGMIVSLPILIMIASLAGDEFRIKEVLINIVVLTLGSWAIFIKGLNLVIPLWPAFMTA
jgi:Tripartite tricarboxylate transporter TctB family